MSKKNTKFISEIKWDSQILDSSSEKDEESTFWQTNNQPKARDLKKYNLSLK